MKNKEHKNKLSDKFDGLKAPIDHDALWRNIYEDDTFPSTGGRDYYSYFSMILLGIAIFTLGLNFYLNPIKNSSELGSNITSKNIEQQTSIDNSNTNTPKLSRDKNLIHDLDTENDKVELPEVKIRNTKKSSSASNRTEKSISNIDSEIKNNSVQESTSSKSDVSIKNIMENRNSSTELNDEERSSVKSESLIIDNLTSESILKKEVKSIDIEFLMNNLEVFELPIVELAPASSPIVKIQKVRKWNLDISVGRGKIYHSLDQAIPNVEYFELWDKNTTNLESYALTLGLSRHLSKGWSIKLEGGIDRSFRKFEFTSNVSQEVIRDQNRGEGYYLLSEKQNKYKQHHRYDIVSSSFLLEKDITIDGLSIIMGVGLYSNISIRRSGNIFTENNETIDINQLGNYTRSNFNPLYSLEIRYPISKRFSLFTNARYKQSTSNTSSNSEIEHKSMGVTGNVGIGFNF